MENRSYLILKDGTVIDDDYVAQTVEAFDEALRTGRATAVPNPHYQPPLRTTFSQMPKYLQRELAPFVLNV
jgi:hypothetical protein